MAPKTLGVISCYVAYRLTRSRWFPKPRVNNPGLLVSLFLSQATCPADDVIECCEVCFGTKRTCHRRPRMSAIREWTDPALPRPEVRVWCRGRLLHRHSGAMDVGAVKAPTIQRS